MRYYVLSVRDRSANVYGQPYYSFNIGAAVRSFSDEINRAAPDNVMYKHPDDFDLYELGFFTDSDASFELHKVPRQVCVGKDVAVSADGATGKQLAL